MSAPPTLDSVGAACLRREPSLNELPGSWEMGSVSFEAWLLSLLQGRGEPFGFQTPTWLSQVFQGVHFLLFGVEGAVSFPSLWWEVDSGLPLEVLHTRQGIVFWMWNVLPSAGICLLAKEELQRQSWNENQSCNCTLKNCGFVVRRDFGFVIRVKAFCVDYVDCQVWKHRHICPRAYHVLQNNINIPYVTCCHRSLDFLTTLRPFKH